MVCFSAGTVNTSLWIIPYITLTKLKMRLNISQLPQWPWAVWAGSPHSGLWALFVPFIKIVREGMEKSFIRCCLLMVIFQCFSVLCLWRACCVNLPRIKLCSWGNWWIIKQQCKRSFSKVLTICVVNYDYSSPKIKAIFYHLPLMLWSHADSFGFIDPYRSV